MTCDKAFDRYLGLDKGERVPLPVTLHLFACPACRTGVRRMTEAERFLARPLAVAPAAVQPRGPAVMPVPAADPVVLAAIERIRASGIAYPELELDPNSGRVSMTRWTVAGFALAAGFAIMPASSIGEWSRLVFGGAYFVPFYLLCGIAVTIFGGLFIGSNIDFFVKKFGIAA